MKRRQFIKTAGLGVAASAIAAPAIAQSMPGTQMAPDRELAEVARYAVWLVRNRWRNMCARRPTANSRFRPLPPAKSCPACRSLDAVQNGTVEMGHTAYYYYIGKDPTWALFCAVPFGLNARQQNAWFYEGDGQKLIDDFGKKFNTYNLA